MAAATFNINRLSRVRDDLCGIEQYYKQSVGPGDYQVTNLVPDAKQVNPLSVEQLLIYPREGYGLNNKSIDADSILRNQPEFKNNRCIIRNQARPFMTVPYMGGGRGLLTQPMCLDAHKANVCSLRNRLPVFQMIKRVTRTGFIVFPGRHVKKVVAKLACLARMVDPLHG